jgi:RimJ/RimL family protein N-acetyltransferase
MNSIAPQLETTRLHLLPPQVEDKTHLSQLWQLEAVQRYMGGVLSSQDSEAKMNEIIKIWEQKGMGLWVVFKKEGNERLGLCGIGDFEGKIEVIYKLFPHQFAWSKLGHVRPAWSITNWWKSSHSLERREYVGESKGV